MVEQATNSTSRRLYLTVDGNLDAGSTRHYRELLSNDCPFDRFPVDRDVVVNVWAVLGDIESENRVARAPRMAWQGQFAHKLDRCSTYIHSTHTYLEPSILWLSQSRIVGKGVLEAAEKVQPCRGGRCRGRRNNDKGRSLRHQSQNEKKETRRSHVVCSKGDDGV